MYLALNANTESAFGSDNQLFYKRHLFSWRFFIYKNSMLVTVIVLCYYTLLFSKFCSKFKIISIYFICNILLFNNFFVEFYQFYYSVNFFEMLSLFFDIESQT